MSSTVPIVLATMLAAAPGPEKPVLLTNALARDPSLAVIEALVAHVARDRPGS